MDFLLFSRAQHQAACLRAICVYLFRHRIVAFNLLDRYLISREKIVRKIPVSLIFQRKYHLPVTFIHLCLYENYYFRSLANA